MNLEKEKRDKTTDLILGGAATTVLVYLLTKWFKKPYPLNKRLKNLLTHTIPPIIIKSSPFEFETYDPLEEGALPLLTSPENSQTDFVSKVYKLKGFGIAKTVKVFNYNEAGGNYPTYYFPSSAGVKVGIWLQYYQNNKWMWEGDPYKAPEILILGLSDDFTINSDKKLSPDEKNNHQIRDRKRKYQKNKIWRFGKVKIYDFEDGEYVATDGDEYLLAFDNHLHS